MSITEHGLLSVRSGQEEEFEAAMARALPLIACQPGFEGIRVLRCLERPGTYLLLVGWVSVEAHEQGFRRSAEYDQWRAALHAFYDPFPTIEHYREVAASGPVGGSAT